MGTIYFVRHGETDWNREGRLQGRTDIDLNARGRAQAATVGKVLRGILDSEMGQAASRELPFHVSPLRRTRQTLELLLAQFDTPEPPVAIEPRLAEIGFGHWEGQTWPEIRARNPITARDRDRDMWNFAPPGGESYADVAVRLQDWLSDASPPCCVVAHGGIARVMMHLVGGASIDEAIRQDIWQGRVLKFTRDGMKWLPGPGHA